MSISLSAIAVVAPIALWLASSGYMLCAIVCVQRRARRAGPLGKPLAVTILKPLCGLESGLYENLRSFCTQNHAEYQIVFGLREAADPAQPLVRSLIAEFPENDISVVVDARVYGSNLKVSNLINMYAAAKHDLIVIADSDMRVGPDYLAAVVAAFADPAVGAVTCLYRGSAAGGLAARLGAMFINAWFVPSVLVALSFQKLRFCFGATMAVRRSVLEAIGGLTPLSDYLADDHMLGKLVSDTGLQVELCPYLVDNIVAESGLASLYRHELRWARTVRTVQPWGYALSFVTYAIPMSALAALGIEVLLGLHLLALAVLATGVGLRLALHVAVGRSLDLRLSRDIWLVPLRDILSFVVWGMSFFGRGIRWKDHAFAVHADGRIVAKGSLE